MDVSRLDTAAVTAFTDTTVVQANYTVSAGSNRYLVVGVCEEAVSTPNTFDPVDGHSATYGGQAMTKLANAVSAGTQAQCTLFGLKEAGIAAASGTLISIGGVQYTTSTLHRASYADVDQTTPVPQTSELNSNNAATPNPVTSMDLTVGNGSAVVALSICGNATTAVWTSGDLTEQTDATATSSAGTLADGLFATGQVVDIECTWLSQNRRADVAIELAAAASGPIYEQSDYRFFNDDGTGLGEAA